MAVSVKDSGMGIPPHMLQKVFQMFTQVDESLEKSQGGLGIGLSLVKTLVEMHQGSVVGLSPGRDQGCEFIVRLPVAPALPAPAAEAVEHAAPEETQAAAPSGPVAANDNVVGVAPPQAEVAETASTAVEPPAVEETAAPVVVESEAAVAAEPAAEAAAADAPSDADAVAAAEAPRIVEIRRDLAKLPEDLREA